MVHYAGYQPEQHRLVKAAISASTQLKMKTPVASSADSFYKEKTKGMRGDKGNQSTLTSYDKMKNTQELYLCWF